LPKALIADRDKIGREISRIKQSKAKTPLDEKINKRLILLEKKLQRSIKKRSWRKINRPEPIYNDALPILSKKNDIIDSISNNPVVIISGETGSGKTTLLNALSQFIPEEERIVTIEDAAEIRLQKPHVIQLEARPVNIEGSGAVTIRDLVRNSLRMRPDRVIVGECRGGEALDMLQAMNTGHDGSITTGHANTPRDMLRRLETMVLLCGVEIPIRAIREQIASAIDVIVHTGRIAGGKRAVTSITEITGMNESQILLQELFRWSKGNAESNGAGRLVATGIPSRFRRGGDDTWV